MNGSCMLIYQTLDNMDGKQARRTGSSSPLGMLFDHGCDAINSPLGSINWCVAMGIGVNQPFAVLWTLISSAIPFYFSTWEEYYTGALVLPVINGPSEGLILGASVSFFTGVFGVEAWHGYAGYDAVFAEGGVTGGVFAEHAEFVGGLFEDQSGSGFRGLKNYQLLICLAAFCAIQEAILKCASVVKTYGVKSLLNLLPFVTLLTCALTVGVYLPNSMTVNLRSFMFLFGILFVEQVTALMLAHMTLCDMMPMRVILFPAVLVAICSYCGLLSDNVDPTSWLDGTKVVLMYLGFALTFVGFKFIVVISEITECLGIYCFDIMTKRGDTVEYVKIKGGKAKATTKAASGGAEEKKVTTRKATRSSSRGRKRA
ncbi:hypothetical protein TL16_g09662 [Triparma laevis f. inornata]|uniref:Uncharacterized protein n=1 Tax=Triparma laevis f. inornata TaxID=1714386 RepID=A0A9W7EJX4_9STRA|nr:hypothetical protein TL16_g09662 [Triparma laevis f. inornata]